MDWVGALLLMQEGNGSPADFSTSVSVYALSSRESAKGVKESSRTVFCDGESGSPPYVVYSGLAQSKLARKFIEEQGRHTPEGVTTMGRRAEGYEDRCNRTFWMIETPNCLVVF